jgi:hypothetical protein
MQYYDEANDLTGRKVLSHELPINSTVWMKTKYSLYHLRLHAGVYTRVFAHPEHCL